MSNKIGAIFSIKDEFSGKVDGIVKKTNKAEGALGKATDKVGGFGSMAKKSAKWIAGIGAGIGAMGTAAFAATNKMVGGFDNIAKTAPKLGITTDAYQEMDYWAGQNGVSTGDMEKAVGRLNQRIGEAKSGNEKYSNALTKLGVNMNDVKDGTVSTEDAMAQSIKGLSEMTNEQDKAAMASELFGTKLGRELMPALQDGSLSLEDAKKKAEELGIVMEEDTLRSAEKFADTWDDLSRTATIFGQNLLADLMPAFQKTMEFIIDKMPAVKDAVGNAFNTAWDIMNGVFEKIKPGLDFIIEKAGDLYNFVGDNWHVVESAATGIGDAIKYIWEKATEMYSFISDNWTLIEPVVFGVVGAFTAYKIITMASTAWTGLLAAKATVLAVAQGGLAAAQGVLNAVMAANPIGIVIVAIGALIGIGISLYKNWDKIKEKTQELWAKFQETKAFGIINKGLEALGKGLSKVQDFFGGVKQKFDDFKDAIGKFKVPKWVSTIGGAIGGVAKGAKNLVTGNFAVGTNRVPRDMTANIHQDEMIIPARQSKNLRRQGVNIDNIDKGGLTRRSETTRVVSNSGGSITIAKLADQIIVREEADIDKIATKLARELQKVRFNMA